jgi:hypothetical protein
MKWRGSLSDNILPGTTETKLLQAARQYIEAAFPNPDRVGCPGRDRLEALARRKCRLGDELADVDHVVHCSACFVEYHTIRTALRRKRFALVGTLVGVGVLITLSSIFLSSHHPPDPRSVQKETPGDVAKELPLKASIDLRPFAPDRGDSPKRSGRQATPISLQRGNLSLTIQLPVGSDEGAYVVQLLDPSGAQRLESAGTATIQNYVTTLEVPLDLRVMLPGPFRLTVRRHGGPASISCPVEVR